MITKGKFVFKTITKREGGEFVGDDGKTIKYDECYILKVDEKFADGMIEERKFKVPKTSVNVINNLVGLGAYTDIEVSFKIELYSQNARLVPTDVEVL